MKNIKILHLLPKLLSLYGEYGNVAILKKVLEDQGHTVTVEHWSQDDLSFEGVDFVYMGSGTEENLIEAAKRLLPHQSAIQQSITGGKLWLVTGNAPALFGKVIRWKDAQHTALNIADFETTINTAKRFLGDVLTEEYLGAPFLGFINTSCIMEGISPMMNIRLNPNLGNDKKSAGEGFTVHNFFATQLIGPVLTKNPHLLAHLYSKLTGEELTVSPDSHLAKAYAISRQELEKRLETK